jgi:hypothetical protein
MTELSFQVGNDPCNKHLREGGGYPWFMHIFTGGQGKEKLGLHCDYFLLLDNLEDQVLICS